MRHRSHEENHTLLGVWFVILLARLDIVLVSLCTKFESSSFSHSWDMDGVPKLWKVPHDIGLITPLLGTVCRPSAGTVYIATWTQNMKSLCLLSTKIWKASKNAKIGVVWGVRGHPRSSETSPFDRAHMTSYSTSILYALSCTVLEL